MKIVFAGPSLPDAADFAGSAIVRDPAASGDVAKAVLDGATVIGIVDGYFENVASVWHKEILFALSEGVTVIGGASMGALRAAECATFGMIGIGSVFEAYASGDLVDDDAVGQVHGPAELGYVALSEPLVNVTATATALRRQRLISDEECEDILASAKAMFFKTRGFQTILAATSLSSTRASEIRDLCLRHRRDVKREDAMALMSVVEAAPDRRSDPPKGWTFAETQMWTRQLDTWRRERAAAAA
jgi:hypothetical protein